MFPPAWKINITHFNAPGQQNKKHLGKYGEFLAIRRSCINTFNETLIFKEQMCLDFS